MNVGYNPCSDLVEILLLACCFTPPAVAVRQDWGNIWCRELGDPDRPRMRSRITGQPPHQLQSYLTLCPVRMCYYRLYYQHHLDSESRTTHPVRVGLHHQHLPAYLPQVDHFVLAPVSHLKMLLCGVVWELGSRAGARRSRESMEYNILQSVLFVTAGSCSGCDCLQERD